MYLLFSLTHVCKIVSIALPRLGFDSYVSATANKPSHRQYLAITPNSQDVIIFGSVGTFFQFAILIDIITGKVRFSAVSNPRRIESAEKGVEFLTNIDRITTTTTIVDLYSEKILTLVTDKQQINNARIKIIPAINTIEGSKLLILPLSHAFFHL